MATVSVKFRGVSPFAFVRAKKKFGQNANKAVGAQVAKLIKSENVKAFDAERYIDGSGKAYSWPAPLNTPNRKPGPTLGGRAGRQFAALNAAKVNVTQNQVLMSISGGPWLKGGGVGPGPKRTTRQGRNRPKRATPQAMLGAVSASMGVPISLATIKKGLRIVRRPFFSIWPSLRVKIAGVYAEAAANA